MKSRFPRRNPTTPRTLELKRAILDTFVSPAASVAARLRGFNHSDWQSVLWWLDVGGAAIYFLDQASRSGVESLIPADVHASLVERLQRNRVRIKALSREAATLGAWLEGGGVPYAFLKGFTLVPDSVSDSALRCQTDLDILVPAHSVDLASLYIGRLGYKLHARSGSTLEFRAGEPNVPDLANIYSVETQRALELHILAPDRCDSGLLSRRVFRSLNGARVASLSPADILVQQALHLLKHLCSEHTRVSWVLEFRRHVEARSGDRAFWGEVERIAEVERNGNLAMGIALWLAEGLFGEVAFRVPSQWSVAMLPDRVRMWLERYAHGLLLSDSIGSKLYVFLRNEVPNVDGEFKQTSRVLIPRCLPARVTKARVHETFVERAQRYTIEVDFFLRRLWFHLIEGIRVVVEASRWRRHAVRCSR